MRKLVERIRLMMAGRNKIKRTDLGREDPGPRAVIYLPHEPFEFETELPVVGGKLRMKGWFVPGSPLSRTVTVVMLVAAGCACAITLHIIGMPIWISAASLLLPSVLFGYHGLAKHP
ncbi:MAG TPA: hypothetical protein VMA73_07830 [Streptosporangiaceae bacterium]|nr:hypothetical protein [Streptosporangiaceae bacterium]